MQEKNISQFNFEQCQKCSICESVCPMQAVNPSYPGPKQAGPDGERYRLKSPVFFDYALKFCLNCKRCEVACPSGVKVADLIAAAKLKYGKLSFPLRDLTLANTDIVGSIASPFAGLVNNVIAGKAAAAVMDGMLGIDKRRIFPKYSGRKFTSLFKEKKDLQTTFSKHVAYFHGCYVNYNYPQLGLDLITVMNACGYGVRMLEKERCCGIAMMSNNLKGQALRNARINIKSVRKAISDGASAVVGSSSSCMFTMREEYPHLLDVENKDIIDSMMLATRFLLNGIEKNEIRLAFKQGLGGKYAYHTACHMQRMGWQPYTISLMRMIPGIELTVLPQECCGIAGTFGFKKENYELSQAIGARLFRNISESGAETVICDCETCKWQIEMSTGIKVINPISLLAETLDLNETRKLNNGKE